MHDRAASARLHPDPGGSFAASSSRARCSDGSASGVPDLAATVGYAAHSGRCDPSCVARPLTPRAHVGQDLTVTTGRFEAAYENRGRHLDGDILKPQNRCLEII